MRISSHLICEFLFTDGSKSGRSVSRSMHSLLLSTSLHPDLEQSYTRVIIVKSGPFNSIMTLCPGGLAHWTGTSHLETVQIDFAANADVVLAKAISRGEIGEIRRVFYLIPDRNEGLYNHGKKVNLCKRGERLISCLLSRVSLFLVSRKIWNSFFFARRRGEV